MTALSYRRPASARTSHDSCCSEGQKGTLLRFSKAGRKTQKILLNDRKQSGI
jgi:hypothetical protein